MALNKVVLNGEQTLDYVWVTTTAFTNEEIQEMSNIAFEPQWEKGTILLSTFEDETLFSGNYKLEDGDSLKSWTVYRQKASGGYLEYVRTVDIKQHYIVDYNNVFGEEYYYYLFPNSENHISNPFVSEKVKACWGEWALLVTEQVADKEYAVQETYLFQLNRNTGVMSNNGDAQVFKTYTQFPKVVKGQSNYMSGTVSSFVGYLSDEAGQYGYYENKDMMDKFRSLSTDPRPKFLKDTKGHIYMVEVSAPTTFEYQTQLASLPTQVSLNWTQVGDTKGLSIYNGKMRTKWLLTPTGIPKRNVSYIWINTEYWKDGKVWTMGLDEDETNDDIYSNEDAYDILSNIQVTGGWLQNLELK